MQFITPYINSTEGRYVMSVLMRTGCINREIIYQVIECFEPTETTYYATKDKKYSYWVFMEASGDASYGRYQEALKKLFVSITTTPIDSDILGFAYAKCAEICLTLEMYDDCLKNINLAEQCHIVRFANYLRECKFKYNVAQKLKWQNTEILPKLELSYRCYKNIPSFAYCLKYIKNKGIRTKKDLKPGDIVAMETPFVSVNYITDSVFCDYFSCGKQMYTCIPCEKCPFVFYCSETCRQKAFDLYHQYLCSFYYLSTDIILILSIVALKIFNRGTLEKLLQNPEMNFEIKENDFTPLNYDLSMYKCIFQLKHPESVPKPVYKMQFTRITIILSLIRKKFNNIELDLLTRLLILHSFNSISLVRESGPTKHKITQTENKLKSKVSRQGEKMCIYGLLSLFTIGKEPNVCMVKESDKTFARVIQPILKGQYLIADSGWQTRYSDIAEFLQ